MIFTLCATHNIVLKEEADDRFLLRDTGSTVATCNDNTPLNDKISLRHSLMI